MIETRLIIEDLLKDERYSWLVLTLLGKTVEWIYYNNDIAGHQSGDFLSHYFSYFLARVLQTKTPHETKPIQVNYTKSPIAPFVSVHYSFDTSGGLYHTLIRQQ